MNLTVLFENAQEKLHVRTAMRAAVRKAIFNTLVYEGADRSVEVSVTFTDNDGIHSLNKQYRNKDSATDVLSFPMFDFAAGETPALPANQSIPLGDIIISLERARTQAAEIGHSTMREVMFLCIHSTLHLLGYDHERSKDDEEAQCLAQREIIEMINK